MNPDETPSANEIYPTAAGHGSAAAALIEFKGRNDSWTHIGRIKPGVWAVIVARSLAQQAYNTDLNIAHHTDFSMPPSTR